MITFSNNLKALRNQCNLSQQQIADVVFVAVKTYQAWENRNIEPPLEKVLILANHYGVTVDSLLNRGAIEPNVSLESKVNTAPEHIRKAIYNLLQMQA
jgi:transcriptional regulator with XRE-family HTH domain